MSMVLDPLYENGFRFDTAVNILDVDPPIMLLHAEDDSIVPYGLGKKVSQGFCRLFRIFLKCGFSCSR